MAEGVSPASPLAAASPVTSAPPPLPSSPTGSAPALTVTSNSLLPSAPAAGGVSGAAVVSASPATGSLSTTAAEPNSNAIGGTAGYGGYGGMYGGMGMDPYMGGMGGMYGMGGLGMMGMGGMGMMGMGMYGMTPEAQRSQMMMFMISRMVELWGMFSNVVQMTLGSVIQFAGNYVGINQRLGQIEEEGMAQEERYLRSMQAHRAALMDLPESERQSARRERHAGALRRGKARQRRPSFLRSLLWSTLRHLAILIIAYVATRTLMAWYTSRQKARGIAKVAANRTTMAMGESMDA